MPISPDTGDRISFLLLPFVICANLKYLHCHCSPEFTDDDLVAQAVLFYVAGYDTTANLINYFIYEMAANPEAQKRLQQEIDTMPGGEDVDMYEAVQELEYLEMCTSGKFLL